MSSGFRKWVLLVSLLATTSTAFSGEIHPLRGVVRAVLAPGEVVIAHEAIEGYMPAMTMAFTLEKPLPAGSIAPGDEVRGVLDVREGTMLLRNLTRTGKTAYAPSPPASDAPPVRLREGDQVPRFALVNERGSPQALVAPGQYTALTFIFTRCPVADFCPLMSSRFKLLQDAILAEEIAAPLRLMSLTIDPEFDQPDQLLQYAESYDADPDIWNFVVASTEETDRIARAFRVYREWNGAILDHTLATALIAPDGTIVEIWRGNAWSVDDIQAAIETSSRIQRQS